MVRIMWGFPSSLAGKESTFNAGDPASISGSGRCPGDGIATHSSILGLPGGSDNKVSACNAGDLGLLPGLGRSPGGRHGNPLWYSCPENPHGQRRLEGYRPWVTESDMTEQPSRAEHSE